MSLIHVKVPEGVFTEPQRREIVERLTDAMVTIEGASSRRLTWCLVEEVAGGAWDVVADDFRALARTDGTAEHA